MKKISNITVSKKIAATSMGKANMVPPHGKVSPKGGGDNYKKTSNTIGVKPR